MILVVTLFAFFASIFSLSKASLEYSEPFFLVGSRMVFAGVILLMYAVLVNRDRLRFTKKQAKDLFLLSFFAVYFSNILEIWGLQHIASSKACLIYSLSPFIAAAFSFFIFREVLSKGKWLGMIVGMGGICVLLAENIANHGTHDQAVAPHWGDLAMVGAVVASVYGWIMLKRVLVEHKLSLTLANGVGMIVGGVMCLVHSYVAGEAWKPVPVFDMNLFLRNTVLMAVISNIICYNLYGYLLKRYSATFMSFAGMITPLFASLFGWLLFEEMINWHFGAAFALFLIGLVLFHREEMKSAAA